MAQLQPMVVSGSAKPTVFVYPFDSELTGEWMYQNLTAGDHDNHFRGELELLQRFKEQPQAPPATADMLVVPWLAVQAFTRLRKGGLKAPGHAKLLAWNDRVIAAMRRHGPWWDTRRHRHAVFAQRCAGPPYERNGLRARSLAVRTWPSLWEEANVTRLCFEPATTGAMGRGIFIPYGVGHGADGLRCPADSGARGSPPPDAPRATRLVFAGSLATNAARGAWVHAMRRVGEPMCRLLLFDRGGRKKRFDAASIEAALRASSFSLQMRGHVGPRKAIFDSIRCGALPLLASERTPLPFSDEIPYADFALRVSERANATRVLAALGRFDAQRLGEMRAAMARAAHTLDCGPRGGMADAVMARFVKVADRLVASVPATTVTPAPLLPY